MRLQQEDAYDVPSVHPNMTAGISTGLTMVIWLALFQSLLVLVPWLLAVSWASTFR